MGFVLKYFIKAMQPRNFNCKRKSVFVVRYAIWYHFYNLKNVKNTHGGVLILKPATLLKLTLLHGFFSRFKIVQIVPNRNASHL